MAKTRKAKPKVWAPSIGRYGVRIRVFERATSWLAGHGVVVTWGTDYRDLGATDV